MGQPYGGFPKELQKIVLKDIEPLTDRPGKSLPPVDFEAIKKHLIKKYNYGEIRTPMFEHYEVISRSVGDTTDIVTKEMYDFMIRETVILHFVQKEQHRLYALM